MIKKLLIAVAAVLLSTTANAQFERSKIFIGSSLTGLDLSYNGKNKTDFGLQAQTGYFFSDNLMALAQAQYQHYGNEANADEIMFGVGGRYYITQNGVFLGASCKFVHAYHNYNDFRPSLEAGYAFFLSKTVTVEPAIYYDQSFKKHSDFSTIGLKVGIGVYLFRD